MSPLKGVLLAFLLTPVLIIAVLAYQLLSAPPRAEAPSVPQMPVGADLPLAQAETSTPALSTPTPIPDRTDCDEIRGTDYRSDSEREFYLANCLPTATPAPAVPAPNPPAIPGPERQGERWILVDIGTQTVSAMIGNDFLYTALATTGKAGWDTPKGTWKIEYRVANETMTSDSIGAEENYVLKDVLYTQYFTTRGHALHLNYWRPDYYFGNVPSSHGCVGMRLADAEFFWRFATVGTRVVVQ